MRAYKRYGQIFGYLRGENLPEAEAPVIGFGRSHEKVAREVGKLVRANLAEVVLFTGGNKGKDFGSLGKMGYRSEAHYLETILRQDVGDRALLIILDEQASNGGENARYGLRALKCAGYLANGLVTTVAHATSTRRLTATLQHEAPAYIPDLTITGCVPTHYDFDPTSTIDQQEARDELLRLADWREKGWCAAQPDLPVDLVEFAREEKAAAARLA